MSLSLRQSITLDSGPAASLREYPRHVVQDVPSRRFRYAQEHGLYLAEGTSDAPPRVRRQGAGVDQSGGPGVEDPVLFKGHAPRWLEGRFRPRNLSLEGQRVLEALDPKRVAADGPFELMDRAGPWLSLEERMRYLRTKYLLLDLLRKGLAVETNGTFWPRELLAEAQRYSCLASAQRRRPWYGEPPVSKLVAATWVALFRRASWDQMRALHPGQQRPLDYVLQAMLDDGFLEEERVPFGAGELSLLGLSKQALRSFKRDPMGGEVVRRGGGVRKVGRGIGEYHEQAVGDAIGYFCHEAQACGADVLGVTLEPRLRAEYRGAGHFPDLRVEFRTDVGYSHWDIEVIGVGQRYGGARRVEAKVAASITSRGFDPFGHSVGRARDVAVVR